MCSFDIMWKLPNNYDQIDKAVHGQHESLFVTLNIYSLLFMYLRGLLYTLAITKLVALKRT